MKYSEVIDGFYQIRIASSLSMMIDVFFTASATHRILSGLTIDSSEKDFHTLRHRAHLDALMRLVYEYGDFREAMDESLRGMELRASWNPTGGVLMPDYHMFDSFKLNCDGREMIGKPHPLDFYIEVNLLLAERTKLGMAS